MLNRPDTDSERGQVGIGTLIVFIALVLVAAVAAGVLIETSGLLESRASDTGADAQAEVSNQISVVAATGNVVNDEVNRINFTIKKSAGSDDVDLDDLTIEYTSDEAAGTLTRNGTLSNLAVFSPSTSQSNAALRENATLSLSDREFELKLRDLNGNNVTVNGTTFEFNVSDIDNATFGGGSDSKFADGNAVELSNKSKKVAVLNEVNFYTAAIEAAGSDEFITVSETNGGARVLNDTSERVSLAINTGAIQNSLAEGAEAEVKFVSEGGAVTIYGVNVADTLVDEEKVPV